VGATTGEKYRKASARRGDPMEEKAERRTEVECWCSTTNCSTHNRSAINCSGPEQTHAGYGEKVTNEEHEEDEEDE